MNSETVSPDPVALHIDARGIARVTLDNPDKHNAFDDRIIAQLTEAFVAVGSNDQVRALVLASSGKSFSAGADLNWMRRMAGYGEQENRRDANALAQMLNCLSLLPVPSIARVQGAAFGGAVGLVSCCDMAVATPRASFCLSEVKIGLIPATISPYVIDAMGARAARRYFTTAEKFSAETAYRLGLISELEDTEAAMDSRIEQLLDAIIANGPVAVRAAKQLVTDFAGRDIDQDVIADTSTRIAATRVSAEGQEGLNAFLEKRRPAWATQNK